MSSRSAILGRIREALAKRGEHVDEPTPPLGTARDWLPLVGETQEDWIALFQKNSAELTTDFRMLDSQEAAVEALRTLAVSENWRKIATHTGDLAHPVVSALDLPICNVTEGCDSKELATCDAGISECDALIAQTGSVLLTSRSAGGRRLSVLPPHHIVLARRQQFQPDLPAAFDLLKTQYGETTLSMFSFITGPSRTGDIERILVLGAHGPKKLTVLVW